MGLEIRLSMSDHAYARRRFMSLMIVAPFWKSALLAAAVPSDASITDFGAVADGTTVNTKALQAANDHQAARGGGTVVVPRGIFVSGALFFKPKVNLHLQAGAVLQCSTDMTHFPV